MNSSKHGRYRRNTVQRRALRTVQQRVQQRVRLMGFSLVELLISIALLATLAALAYPSLSGYMVKTQRRAAQQGLYHLQLQQEAWRITYPHYAQQISDLDPRLAAHAHYSFSITQASSSQYQLTATAKSGSPQVNDYQGSQSCQSLTLNRAHEKTPQECWE